MYLTNAIVAFDWLVLSNVLVGARLKIRLPFSCCIPFFLLVCVCWARSVLSP